MIEKISGIHHMTSIASDPQRNFDFYTKVLGLRLVKKTVNFDSPNIYHLYFGDDTGSPGTVTTFFPTPNGIKGEIGGGQVGVTSYAVPKKSLEFWKMRLVKFDIEYKEEARFDEIALSFNDSDGLRLELVEREEGSKSDWEFEDIEKNFAIKGFSGVVLYSHFPLETYKLLESIMGFIKIVEDDKYIRLKSNEDIGNFIDIKKDTLDRGKMGVGSVHHVAFRVKNLTEQKKWKNLLQDKGYNVTEIKDRDYFTSIYFSEKGGILFEIATDGPGFLIDEDKESLGKSLKLPSQYEENREKIEEKLKPIIY